MKDKKITVLDKVKDSYGITLVMKIDKLQRKKIFTYKSKLTNFLETLISGYKVTATKTVVLWTTADETLVRNRNFRPPKDWLIVNKDFRSFGRDRKTMEYRILDDPQLLIIAQKHLII
jgi:hypothetical protein